MRLVANAPSAISTDADVRESRNADLGASLDARASTRPRLRAAPQAHKVGGRNAKQITKYSTLPARVIDDWPDVVPVASQELGVIESYLRAVLDGFLGTTE
jgi:hypothetical protein